MYGQGVLTATRPQGLPVKKGGKVPVWPVARREAEGKRDTRQAGTLLAP